MKLGPVAVVLVAALVAGAWVAWTSTSPRAAEASRPSSPVESSSVQESSPAIGLEPLEEHVSRTPAADELEAVPLASLIVAGRIVDQFGEPVVGAELWMERGSPETGRRTAPRTPRRGTVSTQTGSFEFRGTEEAGPHHLVIAKSGCFPRAPLPFEAGSGELVVTLRRGGTVSGRVVVDPGVPLEFVEVGLIPLRKPEPSEGKRPRSTREVLHEQGPVFDKPSQTGSFAFEGVCADEVQLRFTIAELEVPVAGLDSIRVHEIGEAPDPRLDPIDLRTGLRLLTIDVEDEEGRRKDGALVVVRGQRPEDPDRGAATLDGRARFLVRSGPCNVDVELLGYRREHQHDVEADSTVHLRPGIPVRVLVGDACDLPPASFRLRVAALVAVESPLTAMDGIGDVGPSRESAFRVSSPGVHAIAWYLNDRFLVGTPRQAIEIYDSENGEQVIHVSLAPEVETSWKRTLRELEEGR